jgi:VWFA-related protein
MLVILLVLPSAGQQRHPYSLSVNVDLVVFNVRVLDKDGRSIRNLQKEAFHVEEDGKPQNVSLFTGEDGPATIGLILDSSGSINSKHSAIQNAALQFVETRHPQDELFILQFNERLSWMLPEELPFTNNIDWLRQALEWTPAAGGRTALYDAITGALRHANAGRWDKRALIVLTDGGDNASRSRLDDVLRFVQESSVTIYAIGLFDPLATDANPSVLRKLAASTGGDAYMPEHSDDLLPVWEKISEGIRTQYTIGYKPSQTSFDGKFHKIRVSIHLPRVENISIRTRPGYRARSSAEP